MDFTALFMTRFIDKLFHLDGMGAKAICLRVGFYYIAFSIIAIIIVLFHMLTRHDFKDIFKITSSIGPHFIYCIILKFFPFLGLLGFSYVILGLNVHRLGRSSILINYIFSLLSLIWAIIYLLNIWPYLNKIIVEFSSGEEIINWLLYSFVFFGFIVLLSFFLYPQYTILRTIRKAERIFDE